MRLHRHTRTWALASLLLSGCVKTTVPANQAPAVDIVQLDVKRGGQPAQLKVGDPLQSGDELAVTVELNQDAFVYIVRSTGTAPGTALHPASGAAPAVTPMGKARLPGDGFVPLGELKAGELVCIAVSAKPLQEFAPCVWGELAFGARGQSDDPPPPPDKRDIQRGKDKVKVLRLPVEPAK